MKKVMNVAIVLLVTGVIASCEKSYTCTCTQTDTSTGKATRTWSKNGTFSREDADIWCGGDEISGFGMKIDCNLK